MHREHYENGFTLAELLIVVAIIGILVAISIPIFANQLERSREATDIANVRSAYAQIMSEAVLNEKADPITVPLQQKKDGFQTTGEINIGGITKANPAQWKGDPRAGGTAKVSYDSHVGTIIDWNGGNTVISSVGTRRGRWETNNSTSLKWITDSSAISTKNSERMDGLYPLEAGKTYTISCTYNVKGSQKDNYGLLASAILLFDKDKKCIMDTGRTNLSKKETSFTNSKGQSGASCGSYRYTDNGDGTYTYQATFTTPDASSSGNDCYFAMNFYGRDLIYSSAGNKKLNDFMTNEEIEQAQKQIQQSFTVEEVSR